jgi:hypothetical protein
MNLTDLYLLLLLTAADIALFAYLRLRRRRRAKAERVIISLQWHLRTAGNLVAGAPLR